MVTRYLFAWIPMIFIAVFNGTMRDFTYGQAVSYELAHQISTITLIVLFALYVWFLGRIWPLSSLKQAALIGAIWLVLTILFEFALGRFVTGLTWEQMFQAYDLLSGNLWTLVPLAVALLPSLIYLQNNNQAAPS